MGARHGSRWTARTLASSAAVLACLGLVACGEEDFENEPRPPVPLQLTGVITPERVTISPNRLGAGPIELTISNQTEASHSVILKGEGVEERVGPVNPQDTATLQKTLPPGQYVVSAGSEEAVEREIRGATIVVGRERDPSNDELLLP
jgi:hypothetical protein